uniref:Uncharacterized protein n=1 Tax=Oryzias sinensis TaxID=183150 RepID=A0A8C8DRF7_9TELE
SNRKKGEFRLFPVLICRYAVHGWMGFHSPFVLNLNFGIWTHCLLFLKYFTTHPGSQVAPCLL